MRLYGFWLFLCILGLLSGCKKSKQKIVWQSSLHNSCDVQGQECEARLVDVPVPLNSSIFPQISQNKSDIACSFDSILSFDQIRDFYIQNMELEGWRIMREFLGECEYLLLFEKPQKICSISIRFKKEQTHPQKTCVFLWTGPRSI